jgi:hypothetical protein
MRHVWAQMGRGTRELGNSNGERIGDKKIERGINKYRKVELVGD